LQWATREVNPTVAILQADEPDCFAVYDYALDFLSREALPIPEKTWHVLIDAGSPADLIAVGYTAEVTFHQHETAQRAWRKAADSGDADAAPTAAVNLGVLLKEQGDTEGARAAWQLAIDSGHTDAAPKAAVNLGILLKEQGDTEGARATYQLAIDSGHTDQAPTAAVNLGVLLQQQGDTEGARATYQLAIDSGHTDQAPTAAVNLGVLLQQQGDTEGARAAYQLAIDSGHTDAAPTAAVNLGILLTGRYAAARWTPQTSCPARPGLLVEVPATSLFRPMMPPAERGEMHSRRSPCRSGLCTLSRVGLVERLCIAVRRVVVVYLLMLTN